MSDEMTYTQRVRSNFPDTVSVLHHNVKPDGTPDALFSLDDAYIEGGGVIVDYVTGTRPPWAFKPAYHITWEIEDLVQVGNALFSGSDCRHHWWYSQGYRGAHFNEHRINELASTGGMNGILPQLVLFDRYKFRIKRMIEKSVDDMTSPPTDLIVFLLELSEIKMTIKYLAKKWKVLTDLQDGVGRGLSLYECAKRMIISKSSKGALKFAADTIADDLLQVSFGIIPLISDSSAILMKIAAFWKKYEDLIKGDGKTHKVRKKFVDDDFDPEFTNVVPDAQKCEHGSCQYRGEWWMHSWTAPEVNVTVMYRYDLPDDWKALSGKVGYALSAMGIRPGLKTVWDRIPFSFVIDWFFTVDQLLDPIRYDPARLKISILDVCASVRSGQAAEYYNDYCGHNFRSGPQFRVIRTDYDRRVGKDLLQALPPLTMPKKFQWLLGAALLWTRGANKHLR
jgi:hypothetical protein